MDGTNQETPAGNSGLQATQGHAPAPTHGQDGEQTIGNGQCHVAQATVKFLMWATAMGVG